MILGLRTKPLGIAAALIAAHFLLAGFDAVAERIGYADPRGVASSLPPSATYLPVGKVAADPPPGFISFCIRFPGQCERQPKAPLYVVLTPALWSRLQAVNHRINKKIQPEHDGPHYGIAEYWNIPADNMGDCKDYALTKRRELIDVGISQAALRIAIVETPLGERHAVLTVVTDRGDYVLDNLTNEIRGWGKTPYRWIERQDPLHHWGWVLFVDPRDPAIY